MFGIEGVCRFGAGPKEFVRLQRTLSLKEHVGMGFNTHSSLLATHTQPLSSEVHTSELQ